MGSFLLSGPVSQHLINPGPVSYTHLDVYKRQEHLYQFIGHNKSEDDPGDWQNGSFGDLSYHGKDPVSYTHLEAVNKRDGGIPEEQQPFAGIGMGHIGKLVGADPKLFG